MPDAEKSTFPRGYRTTWSYAGIGSPESGPSMTLAGVAPRICAYCVLGSVQLRSAEHKTVSTAQCRAGPDMPPKATVASAISSQPARCCREGAHGIGVQTNRRATAAKLLGTRCCDQGGKRVHGAACRRTVRRALLAGSRSQIAWEVPRKISAMTSTRPVRRLEIPTTSLHVTGSHYQLWTPSPPSTMAAIEGAAAICCRCPIPSSPLQLHTTAASAVSRPQSLIPPRPFACSVWEPISP
jgi:hypothetical protein